MANLFANDHNLGVLNSLTAAWASAEASRDERVGALLPLFGAGLKADLDSDKSYTAGAADWFVSAGSSKDQAWNGIPGIASAWFAPPTTDANGFLVFRVQSEFQKSETKVRVLLPGNYQSSQEYRVVYVLPVESGDGTTYGNGLLTVRNLGLHNSRNTIFVAPTFSDLPWYADHITNRQVWQETYFRTVVVPMVEHYLPVVDGPDGRLLLGFSKSGHGAMTMLLRYPEFFGRAFAFDSQMAMRDPSEGIGYTNILGSKANYYANYHIDTLLRQRAALLSADPEPRLFFTGYSSDSFRAHNESANRLMNSLGIPHVYQVGAKRSHHWSSGWMTTAIGMLLS